MRLFLATAKLDEIRWALDTGLADGIMTSPVLLTDEGADADGRELLAEICRVSSVPVCATVCAVTSADIYREGRELAKLADHVIVQVPLVEDAVVATRRLTAEGVRVATMLVFNAAQALLAAKAGAVMLTIPVDQLDAFGHRGADLVAEVRTLFDLHGIECDVAASLPEQSSQFAACALAGADAAVVTPAALRALLLHPLTDRGVDQFLSDLAKRPKGRVAS